MKRPLLEAGYWANDVRRCASGQYGSAGRLRAALRAAGRQAGDDAIDTASRDGNMQKSSGTEERRLHHGTWPPATRVFRRAHQVCAPLSRRCGASWGLHGPEIRMHSRGCWRERPVISAGVGSKARTRVLSARPAPPKRCSRCTAPTRGTRAARTHALGAGAGRQGQRQEEAHARA